MRQTLKRLLFLILVVNFSYCTYAQIPNFKAAYDTLNLGQQFDFLYKKSNRYQEYKVMSIAGYNAIKQNSLDSIKVYSKQITNQAKEIDNLNVKIQKQGGKIDSLATALNETKRLQNSMSLLGIEFSKDAYSTIMWSIIGCLIIVAAIIFMLYKKGHSVVKSTKGRLSEVQEEFDKHRKHALEKEQKLARELMDFKLRHGSNR